MHRNDEPSGNKTSLHLGTNWSTVENSSQAGIKIIASRTVDIPETNQISEITK